MKSIKMICPNCKKEFEYGLSRLEREMLYSLILQDKDLLKVLGEAAAKEFIK